MEEGVSVVICCYNSSSRLPKTLENLSAQLVPTNIHWEIIVVDNASTDNTRYIAEKELKKYSNIQKSIIYEPIPGLSTARNIGLKNAKFHIILFCDDDNWLDENYVATAYRILQENNKIGAVGGQSQLISDGKVPKWFDQWSSNYAVGKQAVTSGDVSSRMFLWGAGLALKKDAYLKAFRHIPSLLEDRKGQKLSSGGDSEICSRLILSGYKLFYNENLRFTHFVPKERLTNKYLNALICGQNKSYDILRYYFSQIKIQELDSFEKTKLLTKTLLSYFKLKLFHNEENRKSHEITIFQISGLAINKIDSKIKNIRKLAMCKKNIFR